MMKKAILWSGLALFAFATLSFISCRVNNPEDKPYYVETQPWHASRQVGDNIQYSAAAWRPPHRQATDLSYQWHVGDARVASIDANGLVTALDTGRTSVWATVTVDGVTIGDSLAVLYVHPTIDSVQILPRVISLGWADYRIMRTIAFHGSDTIKDVEFDFISSDTTKLRSHTVNDTLYLVADSTRIDDCEYGDVWISVDEGSFHCTDAERTHMFLHPRIRKADVWVMKGGLAGTLDSIHVGTIDTAHVLAYTKCPGDSIASTIIDPQPIFIWHRDTTFVGLDSLSGLYWGASVGTARLSARNGSYVTQTVNVVVY